MSGELEPINELQKQFILVTTGELEPKTIEEKLWFKFIKRKMIEAKEGNNLNLHYRVEEDTFHNREMSKSMRGMLF